MKKRINAFLRKTAAKKGVHYLIILVGMMLIFAGADAILKGEYLMAAALVTVGAGAALHAMWFLIEILDAFQ